MFIQTLAWLIGIHTTTFFKSLPSLLPILLLAVFSVLFRWFIYVIKKRCSLYHALSLFSFLLVGLVWAIFHAKTYLAWKLPGECENKVIQVVGYIASVPEDNEKRTKFLFNLIKFDGRPLNAKIQLTWQHPLPFKLYAGETQQLMVKLKRPHTLANPGGFDQETFFFKEKIRALGYVIKHLQNKDLNQFHISQLPNRLRQWFYIKITPLISPENRIGIILALCLGIRNHITSDQWRVFQATGTSHLVAISGLHIGLAAGFFYVIMRFFWKHSNHLMNKAPAQQAAAVAGLFGGFFYNLLAGFCIPAQRALLMFSVLTLAALLRRNITPWHTFSIAVFIVLALDPLATLSESFWLSFGAVFFILYVTCHRVAFGKSLWSKYGKIQWAVTLGLIPMTLLFFKQTSLVSFPANLIAIPWMSFLVIPLALLGLVLTIFSEGIGSSVLLLSDQLLKWIVLFLNHLSQKKYAQWHQAIEYPWQGFILAIGILLLLAPKGLPGRWIGTFTFLPLLFYSPTLLPEKKFSLTLLDVGQGLACLVQTRHHLLLFDTGAKFSDHFDMGKAVIFPFLIKKGAKKIDKLIVSHKDNDHMGGAQSILNAFPVEHVLTSVPQFFPKNISDACYKGQHWNWDGVEFRILYPHQGMPYAGNNSSCTLQIKSGKYAALITGDLEKKGEHDLIKLEGRQLNSTFLIAGHHGSLTSSSWPFIKEVNPKYALFSSGYLNQYRFPHPLVVNRYLRQGTQIENTAQSGAIYVEIDPLVGMTKKTRYRDILRKYWHH